MAAALKRAAAANPGALVLGYGGSVHMSHDDVPGTTIPSAAGRLSSAETVSAYGDGADGSAWNCQDDGCAIHPHSPQSPVCKTGIREVVLLPNGGQPSGFDAIACVGKPFTASPPAAK